MANEQIDPLCETMRDYLLEAADNAEANYRASLSFAESLGTTSEGEHYRQAAYASDERNLKLREWAAVLDTLRSTLSRVTAERDALREAVEAAVNSVSFYTAIDEHIDSEKHPADALLRWHKERTTPTGGSENG